MTRPRGVLPAAVLAGALALATPASGAAAAPTTPTAPIAGSGPVQVAVVVPLTVPPTTTGLLDADALATYTQPGGLLDRQLDAVAGTSAALAIDPMITASIRVQGAGAPADALDFLERLRDLPNDVFLLGYADSDPALAVLAGTTGELDPLGFDFAIDEADFGPAVTPTATPTPEPTGTAAPDPDPDPTTPPGDGPPPLPTTEDLLSWPTTLPEIAWPAEGTVDADGLAGLAELGYEDVMVAGSDVSPTSTALVDLGGIDGLVVDEDVTAAVRDAVFATSDTEFAAARVTLGAALRAEGITSPGRTIIATLDRRWPFGTPRLQAVLADIAANSSSDVVPLADVLEGPRANATLTGPSSGEDAERAEVLAAVADAARAEASFLRIADDPGPITQPRRLALLGLSAVGWRIDDVGWNAATTDRIDEARSTLDAVQIVEGSDQLLLSDISSLRLQVSNALPIPVTVSLEVRPLRPVLHVEQRAVEVTIEPDSTSTASVPVEAVINGEVTVRAELRDPIGRTVGEARSINVNVQAGWETAGTLIAGTLVVLIFGGGLVRAVLRRRRQLREDAAAGAGADG